MSINKRINEAHHHDPTLEASQEHLGDQIMEKTASPRKHRSLSPNRNKNIVGNDRGQFNGLRHRSSLVRWQGSWPRQQPKPNPVVVKTSGTHPVGTPKEGCSSRGTGDNVGICSGGSVRVWRSRSRQSSRRVETGQGGEEGFVCKGFCPEPGHI